MITYTKYENKLQVKVPYELKDLFKKSFKTSKWNSYMKTWDINDNARNTNKLDLFIQETEQLTNDIEVAAAAEKESEYSETELKELRSEIASLQKNIKNNKESIIDLRETNKEIKSAKEEIEALKIELAKVNAEEKEERQNVESFVDSLIDTSELENISSTISSYASKSFLRATDKDDLKEIIQYVYKAEEILKNAGFKSRNLSRLSNTNFNRLDRDNFNFNDEDFYDIVKIED